MFFLLARAILIASHVHWGLSARDTRFIFSCLFLTSKFYLLTMLSIIHSYRCDLFLSYTKSAFVISGNRILLKSVCNPDCFSVDKRLQAASAANYSGFSIRLYEWSIHHSMYESSWKYGRWSFKSNTLWFIKKKDSYGLEI